METIEHLQSGDYVLSNGIYGTTARALIDVVNKLHQCGTDNYLDLPKIAVIGNQSAGKSSLIETISGITLPRSLGTCTRCPIEVMLKSESAESAWKCQVKVFDQEQGRAVRFGEALNQKHDVELVLRRAQLANLNPDKPAATFVDLDDVECDKFEYVLRKVRPTEGEDDPDCLVKKDDWDTFVSRRSFSRTPIVVDITGADVDVTFIDLPGLIQNCKVWPQ